MREGSLEAPVRHPLDWQNPDFYDEAKLDAEMRRVFDICHGCRRCFNLCDSFPRLFDLVDNAGPGEVHDVKSEDFRPVVDACTLCDMCFMTKCPYVPPHAWELDFPHLMLRYRAVDAKKRGVPFAVRQLVETDRNGRLASLVAPLANWATDTGNRLTRPVMETVAGIHQDAHLPKFHGHTFVRRASDTPVEINRDAPAYAKRKAVLYATCFANYNNPSIGMAARAVLAKLGVEVEVAYPGCCGMPQLEQGELERVSRNAANVAGALESWIDRGYDVVALIPSCALMLKLEWPLVVPRDAPHRAQVEKLSQATFDLSEFVVDIAKRHGLPEGLQPVPGGVAMHLACHARAQNMGAKSAEMLRLIPEADVKVIERCSGHGGSWGILKENFPTAVKVGRPVANQAAKAGKRYVSSECPLAGMHVMQGIERLDDEAAPPENLHPIEIFARACGITV